MTDGKQRSVKICGNSDRFLFCRLCIFCAYIFTHQSQNRCCKIRSQTTYKSRQVPFDPCLLFIDARRSICSPWMQCHPRSRQRLLYGLDCVINLNAVLVSGITRCGSHNHADICFSVDLCRRDQAVAGKAGGSRLNTNGFGIIKRA